MRGTYLGIKVTREVFAEYLQGLDKRYTAENYHLLYNNCNHFTNEVVQFLTGQELPSCTPPLPLFLLLMTNKYVVITSLPQEALDSPLGRILPVPVLAMLDGLLAKTKVRLLPPRCITRLTISIVYHSTHEYCPA